MRPLLGLVAFLWEWLPASPALEDRQAGRKPCDTEFIRLMDEATPDEME